MIISSSKGIVKPGGVTQVQDFVPPVQTLAVIPKFRPDQTDEQEETEVRACRPEESQEEAVYHERSRIMDGAKEEAARILTRANGAAEQILSDARKQAEEIMRKAAEEGYQDGYDRGQQDGIERTLTEHEAIENARAEAFKKELTEALASVQEAKAMSLAKYLEELRDCAVAVAEKVIHISLKSSGEVIKRMIVAETEKLKKMAWVKIYMDKSDYEAMIEADADVLNELSRLSDNIKFIVMERDARGSCIIEMPEEIVDISVDTQMENIKEILGSVHV